MDEFDEFDDDVLSKIDPFILNQMDSSEITGLHGGNVPCNHLCKDKEKYVKCNE